MATLDPLTSEELLIHKDGDSPSKENDLNIKELRQAFGKNDEAHGYVGKNYPLHDCAVRVKHTILSKNYAQNQNKTSVFSYSKEEHIVLMLT